MLLTISIQHQPASDIGYLFHKNPDKFQSIKLSMGKAHVFYPEITEDSITIALLLDINPVDLVRSARNLSGKSFTLGQYVNDRPFVASSFMSAALAKAFSTAMNGKSKERPDLVAVEFPITVKITVLPAAKGGEKLIRALFEPLGYEVKLERHILDEKFPDWGQSKYFTVQLFHTITLQELLSHLYVLIPVLDNDKHYYVNEEEIEKLLKKGENWLPQHPEKAQIVRRYLINLGSLTKKALQKLKQENSLEEAELEIDTNAVEEKKRKESLHQQRLKLVFEKIKESDAKTVIDLGCGEGKLLKMLLKRKQFTKITGVDISYSELLKAKEKLYWEEMSPKQKERIELFQGALNYRDNRLEGYDAAAIVEVIEHMELNRLPAFERVVFEFAKPKMVILTTPNAEYNVLFEGMKEEAMRHDDHRFEWTRQEFENWANKVANNHQYKVEFFPIGEVDEKVGAPSQMAVFTIS